MARRTTWVVLVHVVPYYTPQYLAVRRQEEAYDYLVRIAESEEGGLHTSTLDHVAAHTSVSQDPRLSVFLLPAHPSLSS